ncbi:MAG: sigma-70 family RNA polymerase sigma factor [Deltaproteobacteria bacterium]|nr:sigma-70 family RNA polymerase sigma factor [Deltaproteobacteria bacterium]
MTPSVAVADPLSAPAVPRAAPVTLAEIYEAHFDYVWHCVRRLGVPEKDLEDACHDVFVAVHRHLADYDPSRPLKPWLTAFCARVASNHRRSAPVRREVAQDELPEPDTHAHALQREDDRANRQLVARAMDGLDEARRTVLVLHDVEGWSVPDLAGLLGEPEGTLYSRLRTARAMFADAVRRLLGRGDT